MLLMMAAREKLAHGRHPAALRRSESLSSLVLRPHDHPRPDPTFIYDGDRYAYLGQVVERATGKALSTVLFERILQPLGRTGSALYLAPCQTALGLAPYPADWRGPELEPAKPYQLNRSYAIEEARPCGVGFCATGGLLSTVQDLAKFDIALDRNVLLNEQTKAAMLALGVPVYPNRSDLTHGLGWWAQEFMGTQLNWHAGQMPPSASANIVKAPEQNLTFIVLANTDLLNVPWAMGDISHHTMALAFYETFVFPRQFGRTVPEVDWEAREDTLVDELGQVTDPEMAERHEQVISRCHNAGSPGGHPAQAYRLFV